jgi:hypothetical protein
VKAEAMANPAQYGKPLKKPDPEYEYEPNSRSRWRRRKKPETYDPPQGRTQITPAEMGEIRGPDPALLQPDPDATPVEYHRVITPVAAPAAKGGLSFGMLLFIGLMTLLFAGIIYMANTVWGDGGGLGGGSDRCAEVRSKIQSIGTCYSQGYCSTGSTYCEVKPFGMPWGDGCIPNECR